MPHAPYAAPPRAPHIARPAHFQYPWQYPPRLVEGAIAFSRITDKEFAAVFNRLKNMNGIHEVREVSPS